MKQLLLSLIFCGFVLSTHAQNSGQDSYVKFQAPTVASFMKYIDHPVGLFHGNPEISHLLYTLKDGAVELPITLQYNASGIKVTEEASQVGLGWNLSAGGMIVQNAVGKLDKEEDYNITYISDYPQGSFPAYINSFNRLGDILKYETYYKKATESRLQPDVFYFSFPGGSGKFFIDYRDGSAHQIDASRPLKIENMGGCEQWQITTEDGTRHLFSALPKDWQEVNGSMDPVSRTFLIDSSVYPNGQVVGYEYEIEDNMTFGRSEDGEHIVQRSGSLTADTQCGIPPKVTVWKTQSKEVLLKSITTDNYIVEFKMSNRIDLSASQKLDMIVIKARSASQWGSSERRICFGYTYFESTVGGNTWFAPNMDTGDFFKPDHLNKRLKLDTVYEVDASGKKSNQLSFSYYNPTGLPPKTSFAVDYWGYYNGQTDNQYMIPDFTNLHWGRYTSAVMHQAGYVGNRACNPACLYNGMLKSMQYATGGMTTYSYEPHEYQNNQFVPTCDERRLLSFSDAPSILSLRDRNVPTDKTNGYFRVNIGDKVRVRLRIFNGLNTWSEMAGSNYALLFTPTGGTMRTFHSEFFNLSDISESCLNRTYEFTAQEAGNFHFIISLPDALGDQSGMHSKHADFTGDVYVVNASIETRGYNRGGGVRVTTVNHFETSSTSVPPVLSYTYKYPPTEGVLFTPIAFHREYKDLNYYQATYMGGNETGNYGTNGIELSLSSNNFHSAPYSTVGAAVCYRSVTVRKTRFGASQGYTVHTFSIANEISTECSYQLPEVGSGKPLSIQYYSEADTLLKSESYHYGVVKKHFYSGVTITDYFNRSPKFYTTGGYYLVRMVGGDIRDDYRGRYVSLIYGIKSQSHLPRLKIVYQDGVTTTTTYEYDEHCQLKKESVTGSDGKVLSTCYTYPYDFNFAPYTTMAGKNFLAYPVEVKQLVDGKLASSKLTQYGIFGNKYLPKSVTRSKVADLVNDVVTFSSSGASSAYYPAADVTFLKYDTYGNPIHINVKGEDIIYIWGYAYQYPIAEIRKSSYSTVQSALGRTPESLSSMVVPSALVTGLRTKLFETPVTTYTYTPLLGMKTMTTPNGEVTSFEYDSFGRLKKILDNDRKTVEEYDYHYKN